MIKITPHDFTLFLYNLTLLPVIFFSVLFIIFSVVNLFLGSEKKEIRIMTKDLPFISVQIPAYNDPIAERCIKNCIEFDYPKNKYEIIIADDSTNKATQQLLKKLSDDNKPFIKYIHRENREGFKAGALKNSMSITRGEIIVIFDSDWTPQKDFLKKIVQPFSDPKVAIVQASQDFYNQKANLITRFAAYTMMMYHAIIMPINNRLNCVFFCGTAGAIRISAFEEVGGWNLKSVTEDSDLTVNLLLKGYKSVYLDFGTPSELPETFDGFIRQQMRWCYGNAKVFFENAFKIFFRKGIGIRQRIMITYVTLGNVMAPIVILMTLFGFISWFIGEPTLFTFSDLATFFSRFLYTAGFFVAGIVTLYKKQQLYELPYLVIASLTMGVVLAVANSIAFVRAILNKRLHWFCTPKHANGNFV